MIVATAHVRVDGQPLGLSLYGEVVDLQILQGLVFQGKARACHRLPKIVIYNHAPGTVVQLYSSTACCIDLVEECAIGLGNVFYQGNSALNYF